MALAQNKLTLCYPNFLNKGSIGGGSYTTARPLTNAQNRVFSKKARTIDLDPVNTQFTVEFASLARPVHVVSIAAHNFSVVASARIRVYSDLAQTTLLHDSGIVQVYPAIYQSSELEWEYDNYWFGTPSEEDRESITPLFTYFLPEVALSQSVRVELFDQTNPDGYLEFGRVFVADAWQPEYNVGYGINFGYQNDTTFETADDTTEYFDVRRQKRTMNFTFNHLSEAEAFGRVYSIQRTQGISKEILVAFNQQISPESFFRTFIGRQESLSPITHPYFENYEASVSLLEIL